MVSVEEKICEGILYKKICGEVLTAALWRMAVRKCCKELLCGKFCGEVLRWSNVGIC